MRGNWFRLTALAMAAAATLALSACGDDDDDDDGGSPASPAAPAATGEPIKVGYVNVENSPAGSYPDLRIGSEAAVRYVNEKLGGVNGRPIDLDVCITNGSGEGSIACANRFVQDNKTAVVPGFDFGADAGLSILSRAGIPYVGGNPVTTTELTAPNGFFMTGTSPSSVSSIARFVGEDLQAKKVSIFYADFPAAKLASDSFVRPVLGKLGVTDVTDVAEAATAADFTPALTKANEGNPDAIIVLFGDQACSKIMQSAAGLGIDPGKLYYTYACASDQQLEAGGAGAEGAVFSSSMLSADGDDPQVEEYRTAMGEFAPDGAIGPFTQIGFSSIMNLYTVMKDLGADITPQAITAAFKSAVDKPGFMSHPYTCDGQQVPGLTAVCDGNTRILKYEGGEFTDIKGDWVEGVSLLAP